MRSMLNRRGFISAGAAVAAGVAVPGLSGCGMLGGDESDPDTLVVHSSLGGTAPGSATYRAVLDMFRKENPGLKVKSLINGDELGQVYETSRLAHKEADVVMVNLYDKTVSWTELGATVTVNGYLDDWDLRKRILPAALAEWTDEKGRLRALPYIASNWPVAFNRGLLRAAGVEDIPLTGDALIAAARKLRAKGTAPVTIGGNDWTGQKLLAQIIQSFLTADQAKKLYATGDFSGIKGAREGIEYFAELRDAGVFTDKAQGLTTDSMTTQFNTGAAAMQSAMSSALARVPDNVASHTDVGGWPLPPGAVHDKPTILRTFTVNGFWVSPNGTRKIGTVEKFVRFMYRPEVVSRFVSEGGRDMAVRTDTLSDRFPLVAKAQQLGSTVSQVVLPDLYVPPSAVQPMIQATSTAFTPGVSSRRILSALQGAYRNA
ncbi:MULTISPECIES: ABC transporter substrate-binding protein [unclassified Streptomyces]|uniref:ABC transporter substrate-binding protein n=1 Tax=unclassified Streptomyces TaxID=2593676 RepID=UPI002E1C7474|nr:ABC transporter substrate-binding protein [Streptomyces sp. NBC_01023]